MNTKAKTRTQLLKYISNKARNYLLVFDEFPDCLIIGKEDYELIKDSKFIGSLKTIIQENIKFPIVLKK